ncbi:MAG: SpoIIE family protein phosphatase [Bacteroidales bacterium]|nr:SpoIIE family protein phosphatase [Bacteroidales bacterium]
MSWREFVLIVILLACVVASWGQKYVFEKITVDDGLSSNIVFDIYQDKDGLMWFATADGLCSYDGYDVRTYKAPPGSGISSEYIFTFVEDNRNTIWLGTRGRGLFLFDKPTKKFRKFTYKSAEEFNITRVRKMIPDDKDRMWISLNYQGLFHYDYNTDSLIFHDSLIGNERNCFIFSFVHDTDSSLLFGLLQGPQYYRFNTNTYRIMDSIYLGDEERIHVPWEITRMGNKYYSATWGGGLTVFDRTNLKDYYVVNEEQGIPYKNVRAVIVQDSNHVWTGCRYGLTETIFDFKDDTYHLTNYPSKFNSPYHLNAAAIYHLYFDRSENLWIATEDGGVNKIDFRKEKFQKYQAPDLKEENSATIHFIHPIGKSEVLLGGHVKRFNLRNNTVVPIDNFLSEDSRIKWNIDFAFAHEVIEKDDYQLHFIAGLLNGIECIKSDTNLNLIDFTNVSSGESGLKFAISHLKKDHQNRIWVSNQNGVYIITPPVISIEDRILGDSFKVQKLINNEVLGETCIINSTFQDNSKDYWIGTRYIGLVKINHREGVPLDSLEVENFTVENASGLITNNVQLIFEDSKGRLWLGTSGGGLALFDKKNNTIIHYHIGMEGDVVFAILEDDNGLLWMSTNKGISSFNPMAKVGEQFSNFTIDDGLQGSIFIINSAYKSPNGEMFFGGYNGFNRFHPNNMKFDTVTPKLKITDVKIYNRTFTSGEYSVNYDALTQKEDVPVVELHHREYAFRINFAALAYSNPNKNRYAYKLEGFDSDWIYVDSKQRMAYYSNLKPSTYTFHLKASNSDGYWCEPEKMIEVKIIPPWWKTWWFRMIFIGVLVLIILTIYRIRVGQLLYQKRVLESKVQERTLDLQTANMELKSQKEEITQQAEELVSQKEVLEERNEEVSQQAEELFAQKNILERQNEEIKAKNEQISQSYRQLETISDFGQKLTALLDINAINNFMFEYARGVLDIEAFGIGLYVEKQQQIMFPKFMETGAKPRILIKKLNDERSLVSYSFNKQKVLFINDVEKEHGKYVAKLNLPETSQLARSRIHIPLTVGEKKIGLFVVNSFKKNAYSHSDLTNLLSMASYISIALDNAQAYEIVEDINRSMKESIGYAKTIQSAFLPIQEEMDRYIESFVVFRPKDIVSGDFFWFSPIEQDPQKPLKAIVAVADCTGHGVPGAFISLIGNNLLNEAINIKKLYDPAQILEMVNNGVINALKQDNSNNNDGMEIAIVLLEEVDLENNNSNSFNKPGVDNQSSIKNIQYKITFAGAKNPIVVYKSESAELGYLPGSRKAIGGLRAKISKQHYRNKVITLHKNDMIYLFSDGIQDQHSTNRERMGRDNMLNLIKKNADLSIKEQEQEINKELDKHQGDMEQTDDITLLGIRL